MKESRTLEFTDKRFDAGALSDIARLVADAQDPEGDTSEPAEFTAKCADGSSYMSDSAESLLASDAAGGKVVSSVDFTLWQHRPRRRVRFSARDASGYGNDLLVEGDDREWVHSTFTRLRERIDAVGPSLTGLARYLLSTNILAIVGFSFTLHSLLVRFLLPLLMRLPTVSPEVGESLRASLEHPGTVIVAWILSFLFGGCAWAPLKSWYFNAWPPIDLDIGPEHLSATRARRNRIRLFNATIVVPFVLSFVFELFRWLVSA